MRTLSKALQLDEHLIIPIVVFSDKAVFKSVQTTGFVPVVHRCELTDRLRIIEDSRQVSFTEEEITRIFERIEAFSRVSDEVKAQHIDEVQEWQHR